MINLLRLSANVQHKYAGSDSIPSVTHKIPPFSVEQAELNSVVARFTSAASNSIYIFSGLEIGVNGTIQKHPITGATLEPNLITGFCVRVQAANPAVATTGSVVVDTGSSGFAGFDLADGIEIRDEGILLYHKRRGAAASDGEELTINLTGTTGYEVSFICWFEND